MKAAFLEHLFVFGIEVNNVYRSWIELYTFPDVGNHFFNNVRAKGIKEIKHRSIRRDLIHYRIAKREMDLAFGVCLMIHVFIFVGQRDQLQRNVQPDEVCKSALLRHEKRPAFAAAIVNKRQLFHLRRQVAKDGKKDKVAGTLVMMVLLRIFSGQCQVAQVNDAVRVDAQLSLIAAFVLQQLKGVHKAPVPHRAEKIIDVLEQLHQAKCTILSYNY